jgi:hypothetical protein
MMIYKNWPNDAKDGCILAWKIVLLQQLLPLKFFFSIEAELVDEYEDELRDARFLQE